MEKIMQGIVLVLKYLRDVHWNKIVLWMATIIQAARTAYPGLDGEALIASIQDGTIWAGMINVATTLILANAAIRISKRSKTP